MSYLKNSHYVHLLHGFLGSPQDWEFLKLPFGWEKKEHDLFFRNPTQSSRLPRSYHLGNWAEWINTLAQEDDQSYLIGYSLGGRIALHALIQNPKIWKAAVIISSHPGLQDTPSSEETNTEKQSRLNQDQAWARRWIHDPWEAVIYDWDAQSVFQGSRVFAQEKLLGHREGLKNRRDILARVISEASLGHQANLRPVLAQLQIPILWICGANDAKYLKLSQEMLSVNPLFQVQVIPSSGHRVFYDQPNLCAEAIQEFLLQQG